MTSEYEALGETRELVKTTIHDMSQIQKRIEARMHRIATDSHLMKQWEADAEKEFKESK